MKNELRRAKVKKTGEIIEVYKLLRWSGFVDFADCKTKYGEKELQFINDSNKGTK